LLLFSETLKLTDDSLAVHVNDMSYFPRQSGDEKFGRDDSLAYPPCVRNTGFRSHMKPHGLGALVYISKEIRSYSL
jgi:hypothetical protein